MPRPEPSEYPEYHDTYIKLVSGGDISSILEEQIIVTLELLKNLNDEQAMFRYAPDKWTIKQVIGHLIDSERVFAYTGPCVLPGMILQPFPRLTGIYTWKIAIPMPDLYQIYWMNLSYCESQMLPCSKTLMMK